MFSPGSLIVVSIIFVTAHILGLLPAAFLLFEAIRQPSYLSGVVALAGIGIVYPLTLLFVFGLTLRLVPRPRLGRVDTPSQKARHMALLVTYHYMLFSPARWAAALLPVPGGLFFKLAGARIHPLAFISDPECISDPWFIEIERDAVIGQGSVLTAHLQTAPDQITLGKILVGRGAIVGVNCIVFPDVEIGARSLIQAGSVVMPGTKIPGGEVWGGRPAVKVRERSSQT